MIKKFNEFINENDSTYINWEEIEELCVNTPDLPDCVPTNVRQWDTFIKQYEKAIDLVNGKWEPNYDWETQAEFIKAVNEQFYLGKGYKYSAYECYKDFQYGKSYYHLFKNVDWDIIGIASRFTDWSIFLNYEGLTTLPLLPKKVGGNFNCDSNDLTTLEGCPEHVGSNFSCRFNKLTTLKGSPKYVGGSFACSDNKNLISLEGAPNYTGKNVYCDNTNLLSSIPATFSGKYFYLYL